MNHFKRYPLGSALAGVLLLLVAAQGCGDSNNDNVKPPDVGNGGTESSGGGSGNRAGSSSGAGKTGNVAGSNDAGGAPSVTAGAGPVNEAGNANEGGSDNPPIPACNKPETGADGCFNCPKDKNVEQWLNRCSDGDCVPFDNKARLPKLKADGSLPDLPK